MKRNELDRFLTGKMSFEKKSAKRHDDYKPKLSGSLIALPALVRLTRGTKEVPRNNINGVAKALDFSQEELKKAIQCSISDATVYFSLCVALLKFLQRKKGEYPNEYRGFENPMEKSIILLLKHAIALWHPKRITEYDISKLEKILGNLGSFEKENSMIIEIRNTIIYLIKEK